MFSDIMIHEGGSSRVVQVKQRWWLYDDGAYTLTICPADDETRMRCLMGDDPAARHVFDVASEALWELGSGD